LANSGSADELNMFDMFDMLLLVEEYDDIALLMDEEEEEDADVSKPF